MKTDFHKSDLLTKNKMRLLMQRSDHPALMCFVLMYGLFLLASVSVTLAWDAAWWMLILALSFFSVMVCSIFACEHETVHGTAFKSKAMNKVAAFLTGLVHLYPSGLFRELHFTHHRYTHIPGKDPEISLGNKPAPSVMMNLPMYLSWISGLPVLAFKIMMLIGSAFGMPEFLRKTLFPFINPKVRVRIFIESWLVLGSNLLLLWLAVNVNTGIWGIFIGQITGHCLLMAYLIMEHNGLPHEGSIFEKTRSIQTNNFVKLVMWNMPYHADHHAYPAVPFHALPDLHEAIKEEIVNKDESHGDFYATTFGLMLGKDHGR